MNIRQTIITTTVALTMVALVAPLSTGAVTISELQAQINALMAQLQALQGQSDTGGVPSACVGLGNPVFIRNLAVGATGSDVKCGQALLNSHGYQVASSGAGSPGSETSYFGQLTLAATRRFQAAQGWTPASQVGPLTRGVWNSWLAGSVTPPPPPPPPGPTPTPVPTGAGLTVMLATNNPAAGTIVDGQALAPLAKLTFTNGDNAEVKVTGLKLKRFGVSADASLTNVYLFNGAVRLTDGAAVSSTMVNFNNTAGLFMVPSMGSVTISVLSDVDGTSGETVGVQVVSASDVTTNASSVKGVFPVSGNLMTLATGTLAGVEWNATTTPAAASVDPQEGYTVFQNSVIVTTRAVDMTRISFKKTGSVSNTDLQNFKLYVDGVQVGTTQQLASSNVDAGSYATFDLSGAPKRLEAGTRVIKLIADIIGGSNLNFTMHLWSVADVTVVDSQYLANVLSDLVSDAAFTKRSTGEQTVNAGTITITKMTDSPSGDIVDGASNQLLARWTLKAAGERVKIDTLYVSAVVDTASVSGLRNGALYANGVQIGSTTTLYDPDDSSKDYTTFSLGSSLIVDPLSPVTLEARADIYDTGTSDTTNNIVAGSTIIARLEGASTNNNGTGMVSSTTLDVPSADVNGNTLTVRQGSLVLSKYPAYTDRTVVAPITDLKLAHFTLMANTAEAVNLNTIRVDLNNVVSSYATNLFVKYGTQTSSVKPTVAATSNNWSINYNLPAGETIDVTVYATINANATSGGGIASVLVTGTTAGSAVSVNTNSNAVLAGQTITFGSGTFTPVVDSGTPVAKIAAGGQTVEAGKFKFTAANDSFTLKEAKFTVGSDAIASAISTATLMDGSTALKTVSYDNTNDYFNFTGLSVLVPAATNKTLTISWNLSSEISSTSSNSQVDTKVTLDYVKYANSQGTETTSGTDYATNKSLYVFKTIPTVTKANVVTSVLQTGTTVDLYSWKVKADAKGDAKVKQVKFDLAWTDTSSDSTLQLYQFKLYKDGSDITSIVTITDEDGHSLETTTAAAGANKSSSKVIVAWDDEDSITAGTESTYVLRATSSGFAPKASINNDDGVAINLASDATVNASTKKYLNASAGPATSVVQLATSAGASGADANFIWSDNSSLSAHVATVSANTVTATSSGDWSNGFLVKDLPLSGVSWVGP